MSELEFEDSSYIPIDPETLTMNTTGSFDVFIRRGDRMVLFYRGTHQFTEEFREKLVENNVLKLYIQKGAKDQYLEYVADNLGNIIQNDTIHEDVKTLMTHRSLSMTSHTAVKQPNEENVGRYKRVVSATVNMVAGEQDIIFKFMQLAPKDFSTQNHMMNVGYFATALTIDLLGMAAVQHNLDNLIHAYFLHDIGYSGIPLSLIHEHRILTKEERELLMSHPKNGVDILKEAEMLTPEAETVLLQHHERLDGSGYPDGLKKDDIHIYAQICAIADVFDSLTANRPHRKHVSSYKAFNIMKEDVGRKYSPELFTRFVALFRKDNFGLSPDFALKFKDS